MSAITGKAFDFKLFRRVLGFAKPYKSITLLALLLTLMLGAVSPIRPFLIMKMINDYVTVGDADGLLIMSIVVVCLLILEGVIQFFQVYFSGWIGQHIIRDIRVKLYNHVIQLNMRYFDRTPVGTIVTRAVSDIETIADIFSEGILTIIADLLKLFLIISAMFWINWQFTLLVLIPIPILFFATWIFKNAIKKAFQQVRTQVSRLNVFVQEHVTGMSIVQTFNKENIEYEKFVEINRQHRKAHIRSIWAFSIFFPVVEILSAASISILLLYGISEAGSPGVDVRLYFGSILAFILYIFMLYRPIRMLADRFNVLQMGMVGSERVFRVLDTEAFIKNTGTISKVRFSGAIKFNDVWFAYKDEEYVLKNLTFNVKEGQTIAFVGATGAGKSSIINLLSRFYEFQKGKIEIDNVDIREYTTSCLRNNIAVVLQDIFLFSDTIYNNVTLNDDSISLEKVQTAAMAVGAHDFIMKLPGQYDFDVRERGGTLSGGQRQLISFIRAYVYNPSLLILDEATSSIDSESEMLIQKATEKLTENRTSIIVAHRLSTIQKADKIIVIDKGRIVESGTHNELLKLNAAYKRLYDLQFA